MWLYYLIPILSQFLFLPFWFFDDNGVVSLIELAVCTVVIPIYLIIVCYKFSDCFIMLKRLAVMIVITLIDSAVYYFNWGISTSNLLTPDSSTLLIMQIQIIISSAIVVIGWAAVPLIKNRLKWGNRRFCVSEKSFKSEQNSCSKMQKRRICQKVNWQIRLFFLSSFSVTLI